uniref:ATP synthase subunit f n=1 Tax=Euglena gracilis TaxID=3039 RepID=UPI0012B67D9D|nr:Chain I, ATP synthase subunit f [Euglena gracilis]6TDU_i Chain i, ATP synthase subunit f [Euglena gracilis]6TDV_I Chain I, subunit f [Euglena gracilis]6TDV_i Chain i, subunit f [Euglena gracilis]
MAPLYPVLSQASLYKRHFFKNIKLFHVVFYVGAPCVTFGTAAWSGSNRNSREAIFMVIEERHGWDNFKKLSSHQQGVIMQEAAQESLLARNKGELHLP